MKTSNTPQQIVDELTYQNYAHNRRMNPEVTPERWSKILPNVDAMERRFSAENGLGRDAGPSWDL